MKTRSNARQVASHYDADVYYSMRVQGDYLICGKCGWRQAYAMASVREQDKASHATPIINADPLDIACPYATWEGAIASANIWS